MGIPTHQFIAYIDEAGDPGLRRVRPIDPVGSTEWMVISAVLVSQQNEKLTKTWLADISKKIGAHNSEIIHFKDLNNEQKVIVSRELATLPVRIFVVTSNKKNMRRYRNPRAEQVPSKQWFYNWLVRILAERITDWCYRKATRGHLPHKHVKFVFSISGAHSYSQTKAYHALLKQQSRGGRPVLSKYVPKWEVMSFNLIEAYPHYKQAGLQLADIAASAFYQAIDNLDTGPCNPIYAKALSPRVASDISNRQNDYGVILQPTPPWKAAITDDQREIFEFYGYDFTPLIY